MEHEEAMKPLSEVDSKKNISPAPPVKTTVSVPQQIYPGDGYEEIMGELTVCNTCLPSVCESCLPKNWAEQVGKGYEVNYLVLSERGILLSVSELRAAQEVSFSSQRQSLLTLILQEELRNLGFENIVPSGDLGYPTTKALLELAETNTCGITIDIFGDGSFYGLRQSLFERIHNCVTFELEKQNAE